jgi:hypothetical protein
MECSPFTVVEREQKEELKNEKGRRNAFPPRETVTNLRFAKGLAVGRKN